MDLANIVKVLPSHGLSLPVHRSRWPSNMVVTRLHMA